MRVCSGAIRRGGGLLGVFLALSAFDAGVKAEIAAPSLLEASPPAKAPVAKSPVKKPAPSAQALVNAHKPGAEDKPVKMLEEWQPVTHARQAGVTTCLHSVEDQSKKTIDVEHVAASSWSKTAPNDKPFLSAIGAHYNNEIAPNVFSFMFFAPASGECMGEVTQVYPTMRTCAAIEKQLLASGKKVGQLAAIAYVESEDGTRIALIPGPSASCTVVSVRRN